MNISRIHIATDHAGLGLSVYLIKRLPSAGYEVINHGPKYYDPVDDYPAFCFAAAEAVMDDSSHAARHSRRIREISDYEMASDDRERYGMWPSHCAPSS